MEPAFTIGDKAVYPVHGVAEVIALEERDIGGSPTSVYILRLVENGSTIMVPTSKAEAVGLRDLISARRVQDIYSILRGRQGAMDKQTWNQRQREYKDKIRTGNVFEIAEVLRDLCVLRDSKDLSFGERRMLETARSLLVQEIALAKQVPEAQIEAEIDSIFQGEEELQSARPLKMQARGRG